jgi:hypothetical protein
MRRNAPHLIDPKRAAIAVIDRSLVGTSDVQLLDRLDQMERRINELTNILSRQLPVTLPQEFPLSWASPLVLQTSNVKGSVTATNVTSTSGTTITNSNIGPLIAGIPYQVFAFAGMAINAPAGQTIITCARIEATGSTIDGTRTTTTGGERWGIAVDSKVVMGTGASINIAGRARVTGGTGTVNDAISYGWAIPLGAMIEV